jgi:hypothetical protein
MKYGTGVWWFRDFFGRTEVLFADFAGSPLFVIG